MSVEERAVTPQAGHKITPRGISRAELWYIGAMATLVSFHEWLGKQKALRTPVGEFARTALRDTTFPKEVASVEALLDHVRKMPGGSAQSVAIARTAYRAYERSVAPPARL